jgi:dTMP kinase
MKSMARRGKFVTFEGLDGCGKTTQIERLAETLRAEGYEVVLTREPGGTPVGERIRALLLDSRTADLAPMTELALMFSSRAQQVAEVIRPAIKEGKVVLCDRFTDSSEAYQGGGRQLGSDVVLALHQSLLGRLQPDLTILLMADSSASVDRARRRNERAYADEGRFEQEQADFFERVRKTYLKIAKRDAKRVIKIRATDPIPDVAEAVRKAVKRRLKL